MIRTTLGILAKPKTNIPTLLPVAQQVVGVGEYQIFFIDPSGVLYGMSGLFGNLGTNNLGNPAQLTQCIQQSGAPMPKFSKAYGGLHDGAALDVNGNVWHMGGNDIGQAGLGNFDPQPYTTQIFIDNNSNPFNNVVSLIPFGQQSTVNSGWLAIKKDGTLWGWGTLNNGLAGDGTAGAIYTRPIQIVIPGGRLVSKAAGADILMALCTDGTVWTWGGDDNIYAWAHGYHATNVTSLTPHQVDNVVGATMITCGGNIFYASDGHTIWSWGLTDLMGTSNPGLVFEIATDVTAGINLPHDIIDIACSSNTTHAICTDGSLWGWGDTVEGIVGNGQIMDFSSAKDRPYSWPDQPIATHILVTTPAHIISSRSDFKRVHSSAVYTYYKYFECTDGQLYVVGRNKTGTFSNGEMSGDTLAGTIVAYLPDSWNKPTPVPVNPYTLISNILTASPLCIVIGSQTTDTGGVNIYATSMPGVISLNSGQKVSFTAAHTNTGACTLALNAFGAKAIKDPITNGLDIVANDIIAGDVVNLMYNGTYFNFIKHVCSTYTVPVDHPPTVNAGPDQSILIFTATLTGSATPFAGRNIASYVWSQVSGPTNAHFVYPCLNSATGGVSGLFTGVYTFRLTATDNLNSIGTDDVQIIVS